MTAPMPPLDAGPDLPPITMFGPDFPFAYDDFLAHPAGLGQIPASGTAPRSRSSAAGSSGIVTAYELMKMGLKPVVYEADRIGGRLRTVPFDGATTAHRRDGRDALPAVVHDPLALHRPGRPGDRAVPQPAGPGHAHHRRRPQGRVALRRHRGRPAAGLPRGRAGLERRAGGGRRLLRHAGRDARARCRRRSRRSGRAGPDLDNQTFYGFLARLRGLPPPSGTARSSARSASAPAAGTPTSPTPSWRSCASSTPRPTTTTAASSAAVSSCRGGSGSASRTRSSHWPHGTSLASLHGGAPRPGVTRLAPHRGRPDHGHRRWRRHPHLPRRVFTASPGCCSPRIDCDDALFPPSTMDGDRAHPLHGVVQALRAWSTGRSGWTGTRPPAATSCA